MKSIYVKKSISKEKNVNINITKDSKLNKNETKNNIKNNEKNINKDNESKKNEINKENKEEKRTYDLSQMSTKNFNETLFDYKEYSLINNNPIKKKAEFEKELKKTKKSKDISMKNTKKRWIKKDLIKKEIRFNEFENKTKALLSKQNEKSKNIFDNLNIIEEEESNKKLNHELGLRTKGKERNEEEETDITNDLNKFNNNIYKKSQDDFDIDLINKNNHVNDIDNISDEFLKKYKQLLKNKNNKRKKDIINNKKNYESENNFKFFDDIIS